MTLLECRDVLVSFGKSFRVGPASFAMDAGILQILGRNGGGKTTLMRALTGGLPLAGGQVLVSGRDVHQEVTARRDIALVSAIPELPDFLNVAEAWQFTAAIRGAPRWDGRAICAALNLDPALPLASASAGQRQKAELICALVGDPKVLLLDETFAHLDTMSQALLLEWIGQWARSRLVIFTHHGESPLTPAATLRVDGERVTFES